MTAPFHISIAINDIEETRNFYHDVLGCTIGRTAHNWLDIDFFGHQLTAQLEPAQVVPHDNNWQGKREFPVRHFGVILNPEAWLAMRHKLQDAKVDWIVEPKVFFSGNIHEQECMIFRDPNGYAIEFKSFTEQENLFKG